MADITVLNKEIVVIQGSVIINETTKTVMTKEDLEHKLRDIKNRKQRVREQNNRIIEEFNTLIAEETELQNWISQLPEEVETDIETL